jgi:hypothetical protein
MSLGKKIACAAVPLWVLTAFTACVEENESDALPDASADGGTDADSDADADADGDSDSDGDPDAGTDAAAFACDDAADCANGDACDGEETCDLATSTCESGAPLVCEPDTCHVALPCDPSLGCREAVLDRDSDGFAPSECGTSDAGAGDCNDTDAAFGPAVAESCNHADDDCDGETDEGLTLWRWYADCDGDGYAPADAETLVLCDGEASIGPPESCAGGEWTALAPEGADTVDCFDLEGSEKAANAHPGQVRYFGEFAWEVISGGTVSKRWDYDCDGVDAPRYSVLNTGTMTCEIGILGCVGTTAWDESHGPACGEAGTLRDCGMVLVGGMSTCAETTPAETVQPCR